MGFSILYIDEFIDDQTNGEFKSIKGSIFALHCKHIFYCSLFDVNDKLLGPNMRH